MYERMHTQNYRAKAKNIVRLYLNDNKDTEYLHYKQAAKQSVIRKPAWILLITVTDHLLMDGSVILYDGRWLYDELRCSAEARRLPPPHSRNLKINQSVNQRLISQNTSSTFALTSD